MMKSELFRYFTFADVDVKSMDLGSNSSLIWVHLL